MDDFSSRVEALRPQLMRYARSQLRHDAWAEDAVQDTLLAALEKPQSFAGQSQLRTWLVGILKHKLVDQLRRQHREAALPGEGDDADIDELLFDVQGHWVEAPADWSSMPDAALGQRQFLAVLDACVERLPPTQGRVFLMREWLELDSDEVCQTLAITPANLWVMLHRARLRLRECLQHDWFGPRQAVGGLR